MRRSYMKNVRTSCVSRQAILIRARFFAGKVQEGIYAPLRPRELPSDQGKTVADQVDAEVSDFIWTAVIAGCQV